MSPQYDKGWICCHAGTKDSHKCHTPNHKMNMQKKVMKQIFQMYKRCSKTFYIPHHPEKECLRADISGTDSFCLQFVENYTTSCSIAYTIYPCACHICMCMSDLRCNHAQTKPPTAIHHKRKLPQPSSAGSKSGPHEMPFFTRKDDPIFINAGLPIWRNCR